MKVITVPVKELPAELAAAWAGLQVADPRVDSPFFRPEFALAVAKTRDDVEVAVLEEQGAPVGFFPFQRSRGHLGRPVGGRLSDFQGVVLKAGARLEPQRLISACGLSAWYFDHLLQAHSGFGPFHWTKVDSPYIDVPPAFDTYLAGRRAAGSADVMQAMNKKKRSERQLGPIRFELRTTDLQVLSKLIEWKSQQFQKSQLTSLFSFPWTVALLKDLLAMPDNPDFSGIMSALYIGDRLAAAHFGMRSRHVIHWWFPAYDAELAKHSPGSQLLLELVRAAGAAGVTRIDLGKGPESYKRSFMTGATPLAEGAVDSRVVTRMMRRAFHRAHHWARESPLRRPAMVPWRLIMRVRDRIQFR